MAIESMSIITVRVDRQTKKKMEQFKDVNWSEVVRKAIREKIEGTRRSNLALAVLLNERIRLKAPMGYNSTSVIREWRDSVRWKR
ncbi:MAG: hypothetical protein HYU03_03950 [Thaumarchaeota archaeon]|nr:hypothetical protein [Nitrososphaerota archaeon]